MRVCCVCLAALVSAGAFGQIPERLILHPARGETVTVAGKFRSAFYTEAKPDKWIPVWRLEVVADALQTWSIRDHPEHWGELNPIYKRESDWEAAGTLLALDWLAERAVSGIHDRTARNAVGWMMVAAEAYVIVCNEQHGVPLVSVRF